MTVTDRAVAVGLALLLFGGCAAGPAGPAAGPGTPGAVAGESALPGGGATVVEIPAPKAAAAPTELTLAVSHRELGNGVRVSVLERRDLPRVALRLVVGAGTSSDGERAGVAVVAAHVVAATLVERAAGLGADVSVRVGADTAIFAMAVDPASAETALRLLADVVRSPRVEQAPVVRTRGRLADAAQRAAARDEDHAASFVVVRDIYDLPTSRHVYATTAPTAEELGLVTPADVRALVTARYTLAGSALIVVGDLGAGDAIDAAERSFGKNPGRPATPLGSSEPFPRPKNRVTVVDRGPGPSAIVSVGAAGASTSEDHVASAAVDLARRVIAARLGAGATSHLAEFVDGPPIARWSVRSAAPRTAADVQRVLAELATLGETAPSPEETDAARRSALGEMLREVSTADGAADALAGALGRGRPDTFVATRFRSLAATTPELVSLAARSLAAAPAHVVVAGNAEEIGPVLTAIAEVKIVDPLASYARRRTLPGKVP